MLCYKHIRVEFYAERLARLKRRQDRLQRLARSLTWPSVTHLVAAGVRYDLPMTARRGSVCQKAATQEELEYFVGYFDGDGCVSATSSSGSCVVNLGQVFDRCACLLRFREAFGGGVYRKSVGVGMRKPLLQWSAQGSTGRWAAKQLSQWPSLKSPQLLIAAHWPDCAEGRATLSRKLKSLKRPSHTPSYLKCSWAYLAGFFDAEGHIGVASHSLNIELRLAQNNRSVLDCIALFLSAELGPGRWRPVRQVNVSSQHGHYVLSCSARVACRESLERMISAGLSTKREEAELALLLSPSNHLQIREQMFRLSGNQSRYRRLSAEGVGRAKVINRLNRAVWRADTSGRSFQDITIRQQLDDEKAVHALEKAESQIALLRGDIRELLARGAFQKQT